MSASKKEQYMESYLYKVRHSTAHIMAQAVMEMFEGEAKIAIGPPIEDGFYYDFDLPRPLTPEDLESLEKRMRGIMAGTSHMIARSFPRKKHERCSPTSRISSN